MSAIVTTQHGESASVFYVMEGDECLDSFSTSVYGASARLRAESLCERQNDNTVDAAKLLGQYTAGRFDIWMLAGSSKSTCRQHVMSVLVNGKDGKNLPKSKCGVYAIRDEFYKRIQPEGGCVAVREDNFKLWCKENVA